MSVGPHLRLHLTLIIAEFQMLKCLFGHPIMQEIASDFRFFTVGNRIKKDVTKRRN